MERGSNAPGARNALAKSTVQEHKFLLGETIADEEVAAKGEDELF